MRRCQSPCPDRAAFRDLPRSSATINGRPVAYAKSPAGHGPAYDFIFSRLHGRPAFCLSQGEARADGTGGREMLKFLTRADDDFGMTAIGLERQSGPSTDPRDRFFDTSGFADILQVALDAASDATVSP